MEQNLENLKFPIGKFHVPENISKEHLKNWTEVIKHFPERLRNATLGLNDEQLQKQYRPNGWTIKQVVHHCADSHMNSLIRFKLTLTEDTPTIKPYLENLWAELPDAKDYPIESSLQIIEGLHEKWTTLLTQLSEQQLEREFIHPEGNERISLKKNIGIYAWHCQHHLAHILIARNS
ncbi:YfiT family bacillithiol transferase [Pedobacter nanyangensis]|uniref:YfiT family bacillithiol transferase n=1 Tax=Pedobacter nanyangensis TaxID=1562389 RepID=UPI000DE3F4F9|nr:putative metal-dependent hydrolase [Pedobacter nanyangensis]